MLEDRLFVPLLPMIDQLEAVRSSIREGYRTADMVQPLARTQKLTTSSASSLPQCFAKRLLRLRCVDAATRALPSASLAILDAHVSFEEHIQPLAYPLDLVYAASSISFDKGACGTLSGRHVYRSRLVCPMRLGICGWSEKSFTVLRNHMAIRIYIKVSIRFAICRRPLDG